MSDKIAKDVLAEQGLIVGLFAEPSLLDTISERLRPSDFFEPKHEVIYSEMLKLREQGKNFDPISLAASLKKSGILNTIGGITYLKEMVDPTNITQYASDPIGYSEVIIEHSRLRKLRNAAQTILEVSEAGKNLSADDATAIAEREIFNIVNDASAQTDIYNVTELYEPALEEAREAATRPEGVMGGIPSGFPDFDRMTNGFHPGQMVIIAARPGVGKSTLAVDFARAASFLAGKTVLFFSLEMSKEELMQRILAAEARIELQKIRSGELDEREWMDLRAAKSKIAKGNFLIDATPRVNISRIRSMAMRQMQRPEGLDMIVIDYLGLMETTSIRKSDSRQNEISELSRSIKLMAKELQVPIITLSQLNRNSEARLDRVPQVSDLRESGSLEQDADMVLLIHRPEVGDENNRPGEADLIIGKQRSGPQGKVPLTSMLAFSKFVPGQGLIKRESTMMAEDGYSATDDETPW
jgi:replicative DNA helicase